ncbi:unnamed protein product [Diabrotica balteata]|uniref:Uncharacterized protein n=1 Tax=Diabrotica balteata TaxID=107213 RepID=A0A9N9T377_DIABA|nr:unnamed protein product [Diabrotica balteata]
MRCVIVWGQPVPKVIVMGSSTASETTINTSTESSNTIVTTVTATDGTDESLDYPEPIDLFSSENVLDSKMSNPILQPCPLSPKTPATAKQQTPPTAKNQTMFTFEINEPRSSTPVGDSTPKVAVSETKFIDDHFKETEVKSGFKTVDSLMQEQIEALRIDARRRNSYKQAAQTLDEIEILSDSCFNKNSPKEHRRSFKKKLDVEKQKVEKSSPKRRAERNISSHKKTSRRTRSPNKYHHQTSENFNYNDRQKYRTRSSVSSTSSRRTPPPPDLRVDFFSETSGDSSVFQRPSTSCQMNGASTPTFHTLAVYGPGGGGASTEKRGSVCLNKCLREVYILKLVEIKTNSIDKIPCRNSSKSSKKSLIAKFFNIY